MLQHVTAARDLLDPREVEQTYLSRGDRVGRSNSMVLPTPSPSARSRAATNGQQQWALTGVWRPRGLWPAHHRGHCATHPRDAGGSLAQQARGIDEPLAPISTVHRTPLALCDCLRPCRRMICMTAKIRGGLDDPDRPPLYGYNLSYNPDHCWYYTSQMPAWRTLRLQAVRLGHIPPAVDGTTPPSIFRRHPQTHRPGKASRSGRVHLANRHGVPGGAGEC